MWARKKSLIDLFVDEIEVLVDDEVLLIHEEAFWGLDEEFVDEHTLSLVRKVLISLEVMQLSWAWWKRMNTGS